MLNFAGMGRKFEEMIVNIRRDFHRNPELSGEEVRTAAQVKHFLQEWGIEYKSGFAKYGVLGIIQGDADGPVVALRADMDALPIQEENLLDYISQVPGKMHACGHDAHTAILLGSARLLKQFEKQIPGTILLVFQPAEEDAPTGGVQPMLDDGLFQMKEPDAIFGLHVWPYLPVGQIGVKTGVIMGASDRFSITLHGKGGHASMPHQSVDAVIIANQVISSLQTIVSRNVDPLHSVVITIGVIKGGDRYNVIADKVEVEGTIRTLSPEDKEIVKNRFFEVVEKTTLAMGGKAEINYWDGYPPTVNSEEESQLVKEVSKQLLGTFSTPHIEPSMAGEDFSRFLQRYRGAFFWLGAGMDDPKLRKPLHDRQFQLDESCLSIGVELISQIAVQYIEQHRYVPRSMG